MPVQEYGLQYTVLSRLGGISRSPAFSVDPGNPAYVAPGEAGLREFEVDELGIVDLSLAPDTETVGFRMVKTIWISAPANSTPGRIKIVDTETLEELRTVSYSPGAPAGNTLVYRRSQFWVPQGASLRFEGWEATPDHPIRLRVSVRPATTVRQWARWHKVICCTNAVDSTSVTPTPPPPSASTVQSKLATNFWITGDKDPAPVEQTLVHGMQGRDYTAEQLETLIPGVCMRVWTDEFTPPASGDVTLDLQYEGPGMSWITFGTATETVANDDVPVVFEFEPVPPETEIFPVGACQNWRIVATGLDALNAVPPATFWSSSLFVLLAPQDSGTATYARHITQSYLVGDSSPPPTEAPLVHGVTGLDYMAEPSPYVLESVCVRVGGGIPAVPVTLTLFTRTPGGAWTEVASVTEELAGDEVPVVYEFDESFPSCEYWHITVTGLDRLEPPAGPWTIDGFVALRPLGA